MEGLSAGELFAIGAAGYAFLRTFSPTRDRLARLGGGYDVLFYSAGLGIVLFASHQAFREECDWVQWTLALLGVTPTHADNRVDLAAFVVSVFVMAALLNAVFLVPPFSRLRTLLLRVAAQRRGDLLYVTLETNDLVEVALNSGKSYVGIPRGWPYPVPGDESTQFIQLIPLFSGYRAPPERSLRLVNYYGRTSVQRLFNGRDDLLSIAVREIVSARAFDPNIYDALNRPVVALPQGASPTPSPSDVDVQRWGRRVLNAVIRLFALPSGKRRKG